MNDKSLSMFWCFSNKLKLGLAQFCEFSLSKSCNDIFNLASSFSWSFSQYSCVRDREKKTAEKYFIFFFFIKIFLLVLFWSVRIFIPKDAVQLFLVVKYTNTLIQETRIIISHPRIHIQIKRHTQKHVYDVQGLLTQFVYTLKDIAFSIPSQFSLLKEFQY